MALITLPEEMDWPTLISIICVIGTVGKFVWDYFAGKRQRRAQTQALDAESMAKWGETFHLIKTNAPGWIAEMLQNEVEKQSAKAEIIELQKKLANANEVIGNVDAAFARLRIAPCPPEVVDIINEKVDDARNGLAQLRKALT